MLCGEAKVVCAPSVCEFGKHFKNLVGSRGSGCSYNFCNTKDNKRNRVASIVRESGKHSQNSLSERGDVFLVRQRHHQ